MSGVKPSQPKGGLFMLDIFSNSCLLIIDFQNFFVRKNSRGFLPNSTKTKFLLKKLINNFIKEKKLVIATRHFNFENEDDPFYRFYGKIIKKGSFWFQLSSPLSKLKNIVVINKITYSPFLCKDFEKLIKKNKIKNIFVGGVLLEKCVLATSFDAFQRNYNVFVVKECVAARDKKNEEVYFDLLKRSCCKVISIKEIVNV